MKKLAYDKTRTNDLLARTVRTEEDEAELVKLNSGLFWNVIKRFGLFNDPEAESLGYLTLLKAIREFDRNSTTQFSTYATVSIYNRLGSYVRTLNTQMNTNTISYDALANDSTTYLSFMESPNTADGDALQTCGVKYIKKYISEYLEACKNPTHKEILTIWIKSKFKITNIEISKQLNCSQSYVNQTINKFRKSLKNKLRGC